MDPIFRLATAALEIALVEHTAGSHKKMQIQSATFTETYNKTTRLIQGVIQANSVYKDRHTKLCQRIVARGNLQWPQDDSEEVGNIG